MAASEQTGRLETSRSLAGAAASGGIAWPRAGLALLVGLGYYLGARLGLALTFEPLPISVLWPPNAVLFAALLLVPTRNWWIVLAAALPAHLASELPAGIPLAMVISWYVSNVSEALIGAGLLRMAIGEAHPFDSPRDTMLFFCAAVVATVLSSFLDSAFVKLNDFSATPYWELWKARTVSNLVADVVVAAALLSTLPVLAKAVPRFGLARFFEALVIATGLAFTAVVVFDSKMGTGASAAQIYLPIPFLLWAAFRFGPAGASLSFSSLMLIAIWGAGRGVGVLGTGTPRENVQSLQLLALCLGPTLLCFGAAIEERRRNARIIRESHLRLRLVLEATRDTVYEHDLQTGELRWSHSGAATLGYEGSESLRNSSMLIDAIHPDDRQRTLDVHEDALSGRKRKWQTEYRLRRADGTYAHVIEHGFVVRESESRALEVIGRLIDVSERRDTEELNHRLTQASKLTAMGELAASIAHEINQPMGAILSNVDAAELLLDQGRLGDDELRVILGDIRSDNQRAGEIIRHMRTIAKTRELHAEPFDMNRLVEGVLRLATCTARIRGLVLRADLGDVPNAIGDRVHAEQVLLNLLFNAMDAMRDAPARCRNIVVTTGLDAESHVNVSVRDEGHGIAPGQLDRIFELFFTTKSDGLGLGLPIARSLVTANGGRIGAERNVDGGTTVRFTFPTRATRRT